MFKFSRKSRYSEFYCDREMPKSHNINNYYRGNSHEKIPLECMRPQDAKITSACNVMCTFDTIANMYNFMS
jgi:hypothetical protein